MLLEPDALVLWRTVLRGSRHDPTGPPSGIGRRELARSDDVELLEIVLPAHFATESVAWFDG